MFTGLCARFVAELGLNRVVADVAARLLAAHESDGLRAHGGPVRGSVLRGTTRSRLPAAPPHVHAMAYVVAAITLLHGLAGVGDVDDADDAPGWRGRRTEARRAGRNATPATRRGRRSLPAKNGSLPVNNGPAASERKLTIDPPRGGWVAWAERTMREGASAPRLPARVAEAATRTTTADDDDDGDDDGASASHRESVDAFLEYCKSHALRGLEGGLPEAHRRTVDALWRIHDARGADVPSDGPLVPPRPTADLAPAPSPRGFLAPLAAGRVDDLAAASRRTGSIDANLNLAEHVFTAPVSTRGASRLPAKLTSVQNAESYVAVVRACAGHAWADPQALHECARDVDFGFVGFMRRREGDAGKGKGTTKGKGKGKGKGTETWENWDDDAGGLDEYASVVEGLERRFLRAAEVPEFPEPASRVKEDVPDVPNVPNVPDEETKTKRRRSSAAAIMPPPPPRLPAVATAPPTTARMRAKKKRRARARVDGF